MTDKAFAAVRTFEKHMKNYRVLRGLSDLLHALDNKINDFFGGDTTFSWPLTVPVTYSAVIDRVVKEERKRRYLVEGRIVGAKVVWRCFVWNCLNLFELNCVFHEEFLFCTILVVMLNRTSIIAIKINPFQTRKDVPVTVTFARSDGSEEEREVHFLKKKLI